MQAMRGFGALPVIWGFRHTGRREAVLNDVDGMSVELIRVSSPRTTRSFMGPMCPEVPHEAKMVSIQARLTKH